MNGYLVKFIKLISLISMLSLGEFAFGSAGGAKSRREETPIEQWCAYLQKYDLNHTRSISSILYKQLLYSLDDHHHLKVDSALKAISDAMRAHLKNFETHCFVMVLLYQLLGLPLHQSRKVMQFYFLL